jgi:hypothetical protein
VRPSCRTRNRPATADSERKRRLPCRFPRVSVNNRPVASFSGSCARRRASEIPRRRPHMSTDGAPSRDDPPPWCGLDRKRNGTDGDRPNAPADVVRGRSIAHHESRRNSRRARTCVGSAASSECRFASHCGAVYTPPAAGILSPMSMTQARPAGDTGPGERARPRAVHALEVRRACPYDRLLVQNQTWQSCPFATTRHRLVAVSRMAPRKVAVRVLSKFTVGPALRGLFRRVLLIAVAPTKGDRVRRAARQASLPLLHSILGCSSASDLLARHSIRPWPA